MLILHAAREVVEEEGFDEILDNVRDRIDEIESLHRTRELTVSFILLDFAISPLRIFRSSRIWKGATALTWLLIKAQ